MDDNKLFFDAIDRLANAVSKQETRIMALESENDDKSRRIAQLELKVSELRHVAGITEVDELAEQFDAEDFVTA